MQLSSTLAFPMVMKSAIDLGLLDIISRAGSGTYLSPQQIASQLHTNNPEAPQMVDRILRLLASYSVVTCKLGVGDDLGSVQIRLYGLTPVGKYFLQNNQEENSLSPCVKLSINKVFMETWYDQKDAVLEGGVPFNRVYGMHAYEYLGKDPKFNQIFNKAMTNYSTMNTNAILGKYKGFENIKQLVDVLLWIWIDP
ncbi:Caffeic acid O-methyltransferase [Quillaja saponaria]|uniref:Caffeic acid O-methyltransferase n=1 Tax=Quillaja saponaria TaxID=32244 RepID=A0AAD7LSI5_QUISA|nr:Caffeic acid O-methyltransferase [Quillaja saponaria]